MSSYRVVAVVCVGLAFGVGLAFCLPLPEQSPASVDVEAIDSFSQISTTEAEKMYRTVLTFWYGVAAIGICISIALFRTAYSRPG